MIKQSVLKLNELKHESKVIGHKPWEFGKREGVKYFKTKNSKLNGEIF